MQKMIRIGAWLVLGVAAPAQAGWNSGGAVLFSDAVNPWFVQNTAMVDYCIEIDEANFGQDLAVAREKIRAAFAFWKEEFTHVPDNAADVPVRLATQEFFEVPCHAEIGIKFQLGTLTSEQALFLKHPDKVIAQAVRTDYDSRALRGKGFVYVSPETGPNALNGISPLGTLPIESRWRREGGKLLELILIHELGHVFGLQHRDDTLMEETIPAYIISDPFARLLVRDRPNPRFFVVGEMEIVSPAWCDYRHWGPDEDTQRLLGVPADAKRLELRPAGGGTLELRSWSNLTAMPTLLGTFEPDDGRADLPALISLYLTPDQAVFPVVVPASGSTLALYIAMDRRQTSWFRPVDGGLRRHMALAANGAGIKITAIRSDGRIAVDLAEFSSWDLDYSRLPEETPKSRRAVAIPRPLRH